MAKFNQGDIVFLLDRIKTGYTYETYGRGPFVVINPITNRISLHYNNPAEWVDIVPTHMGIRPGRDNNSADTEEVMTRLVSCFYVDTFLTEVYKNKNRKEKDNAGSRENVESGHADHSA